MGTDPGSADLAVDPAVVEATKSALHKALESLQDYPFETLGTIQPTSFGTNGVAESLSAHHSKAHEVMAETLAGVRQEINAYLDALGKAVDVMHSVDEQNAAWISQQHQLVDDLDFLHHHSDGDRAHDHARNHQDDATSGVGA